MLVLAGCVGVDESGAAYVDRSWRVVGVNVDG